MKTKNIIRVIFVGLTLTTTSCTDFLDLTPTDQATDKMVWSTAQTAELAVNDFYHLTNTLSYYGDGQCIAGMTEGLTDMVKYADANYNVRQYIPSEISYAEPTIMTANYVNVYLGTWQWMYDKIRRTNEALYNLEKYSNFSSADKLRFESELRFFRGMLYFELIKRYKQVIIYDKDVASITANKVLSTEAQGWEFVYQDLNYAGVNLTVSSLSTGRVTSGAAFSLLSRAMLYAERWNDAREAAKKVIDSQKYSLAKSYPGAFDINNNEAIWAYTYSVKNGVSHLWDNYYAPGGDKQFDGNSLVGGLANPTQELVESFEKADGSGFPDWTPWHVTSGTSVTPPYNDLEPRFKATVLYNGSSWKGRSIEPFVGGLDGWVKWLDDPSATGRTATGYYLRKLVNESHSFKDLQASVTPAIYIRFAEVLLNYAEACAHLGGIYNTEANNSIKAIRQRVGLMNYLDKSGDELLAVIRQERKVELMCEGFYYWDMRRWKLSDSYFTGKKRHGFKIEQVSAGVYKYSYVEVDYKTLNFPSKMYQYPLPTSELNGNKLVEQFPEWK